MHFLSFLKIAYPTAFNYYKVYNTIILKTACKTVDIYLDKCISCLIRYNSCFPVKMLNVLGDSVQYGSFARADVWMSKNRYTRLLLTCSKWYDLTWCTPYHHIWI